MVKFAMSMKRCIAVIVAFALAGNVSGYQIPDVKSAGS